MSQQCDHAMSVTLELGSLIKLSAMNRPTFGRLRKLSSAKPIRRSKSFLLNRPEPSCVGSPAICRCDPDETLRAGKLKREQPSRHWFIESTAVVATHERVVSGSKKREKFSEIPATFHYLIA